MSHILLSQEERSVIYLGSIKITELENWYTRLTGLGKGMTSDMGPFYEHEVQKNYIAYEFSLQNIRNSQTNRKCMTVNSEPYACCGNGMYQRCEKLI